MDEINANCETGCIDGLTDKLLNESDVNHRRPTSWVCLDEKTIQICWEILYKNSLAHACRSIKYNYLFKMPFQLFTQEGEEMHLTSEFSVFFENHFKKFARDFLDAFMVIGVVPCVIMQDANGFEYPQVLAPNTYLLQIAYVNETGKRYYRAWRQRKHSINQKRNKNKGFFGNESSMGSRRFQGGRAFSGLGGAISDAFNSNQNSNEILNNVSNNWYVDDDILVIDGLGHDPMSDGNILSPMSAVIPDLVFTNTLTDTFIQAQMQMVDPIFITQHHKMAEPEEQLDPELKQNLPPVFDTDELSYQVRKNKELDKEQTEALKAQYKSIRLNRVRNTSNEANKANIVYTDKTIELPKGLEYVRGDGLERYAGTQFFGQRDRLEESIARAFGISMSMLKINSVARGMQESIKENFRNRISDDAEMLATHITYIFNEIYGNGETLLDIGLLRRKEVIDDTQFSKIPKSKSGNEYSKVDVVSTQSVAPIDDNVKIFKDQGNISIDRHNQTIKDRQEKIRALRKKNVEHRKQAEPEATTKKRKRRTFGNVIVSINVAIHTDGKTAKHAWDVGAINTETYHSILRAKIGLGRLPSKPNPDYLDQVVSNTIRAPGSEPPRADAYMPESELLGTTAKKFNQEKEPAPGMLLEAVEKKKATPEDIKDLNKNKAETPTKKKKKKTKKSKEESDSSSDSD